MFVFCLFIYCFATERKSESTSADQQRGTKRGGSNKTTKDAKKVRWRDDEESSGEESDSTVDSEDEISLNKAKQKKKETQNPKQNDFEVVPIEDNSKYIFFLVNVPQRFTLCKGIGIPESGKFFACGIRNPGFWNPEYSSRNQESH